MRLKSGKSKKYLRNTDRLNFKGEIEKTIFQKKMLLVL